MLREIREQPAVAARLLDAGPSPVAALARRLRRRPRACVVLAARGTSDHAALYGKYLIEALAGIPAALAAPSLVTLYRRPLRVRDALVIGLSQSGESTDVVEFVEHCRAQGALTAGVTNAPGSALARAADVVLPLRAGPERSVAATKTYLAQLVVLARLVAAWARDRAFERALADVPAALEAALGVEPAARALALGLRDAGEGIVAARGFNYATARETALKLKETCHVWAEAVSTADLLHGPIAAVRRGLPVLIFALRGPAYAHVREVAARVRALGARVVAIDNGDAVVREAGAGIRLPVETIDPLSPIPAIVPGQLLAYHLAVARGLDPDRPGGLRKITRTR